MKKKRLIIFMPSIEGGGVEKNLFIISNYLAIRFDKTILITTSRKFNNKFNNLKIINPNFKFNNNHGRKLRYFYCLFELFKLLIKKENFILFAFQANLYCALMGLFFPNLKIITRSNSAPFGWSKNFLKKLIFKILFKRINLVIVNSEQFKKDLKKEFKVNAICIYNPLNLKEIKKKSKEKVHFEFFNTKDLKIINIGRLVDQKDQLTFLKALNLIKEKIKFRALIIGSGIKKSCLQEYIMQHKLNSKVKIINFKTNPYKYLSRSNLLVHTAIFEGLPNVLLEAISLNKYIISTNCSTGPSEILSNGKGGDLIKLYDFKELAKKILFYNFNQRKLIKKKKFAYKNLYRFNYELNLKKYYFEIKKFI